jgi:uncharacterized membrane protein
MEGLPMWTRTDLKSLAKANLTNKYWIAFGASIMLLAVNMALSMITSPMAGIGTLASMDWSSLLSGNYQDPRDVFDHLFRSGYFSRVFLSSQIISWLTLAVSLFVMPAVQVGINRWFSRNREAPVAPSIGQVFSIFKRGSYLKTIGSMLWMDLFLFLWSLLAIIPVVFGGILLAIGFLGSSMAAWDGYAWRFQEPTGRVLAWVAALLLVMFLLALLVFIFLIPLYIKMYSYRLTPWILADNPAIGYQRALKLSMALTRGQKWRMFVLDLSFLGWYILGMLACGIGVLFVMPYYNATQAELYARLRQGGVEQGVCTMEELGFVRVG